MIIDRCSRFVFLAVYDAENAANAFDFLRKAKQAFPFRITRILTDRGSCFTAEAFEEACAELKVPHRQTKPYTPQTNGMVKRVNGRIASDVFGISVASHADLEILLTSFNHAYNRRRQRVLLGHSPMEKVDQRLVLQRNLANPLYKPPANQKALEVKVNRILYDANEVSQPHS